LEPPPPPPQAASRKTTTIAARMKSSHPRPVLKVLEELIFPPFSEPFDKANHPMQQIQCETKIGQTMGR
jgi:hypothetical protein